LFLLILLMFIRYKYKKRFGFFGICLSFYFNVKNQKWTEFAPKFLMQHCQNPNGFGKQGSLQKLQNELPLGDTNYLILSKDDLTSFSSLRINRLAREFMITATAGMK
jgi:hypothetical protein